jgi:hypothetical protein
MSWSTWPSLRKTTSQPTKQKRKGRHPQGLQLCNRQGIGWSRTPLPEHRLEVTCLADGWPDHPSRHDLIDHRHHNLSSNNNRVRDRAFHPPTKETTTIVVSTAAARPTLSRIAPQPRRSFQGQTSNPVSKGKGKKQVVQVR